MRLQEAPYRQDERMALQPLQYGEDAVKEGMGGGPPGGAGGMADIFEMFAGGGRRGPRERRGENVVHRLKVSLEEVYNGGTRCALGGSCMQPAC